MNNTKIIIIGASNIDKLKLAKQIVELDDDLEIAYTFISDTTYSIENDLYLYYADNNEINLTFKNNACLYVYNTTNESYITKGITIDMFYNTDISVMDITEFNTIADSVFVHNDILVIWLDTKYNSDNVNIHKDICEIKYLTDRLDYIKYMYFLDEPYNDISNTIIKYLNSTETEKQELLIENS